MATGLRSYTIKECDYKNIVYYFNNNHENGAKEIAKYFKLNIYYVDYIIDVYLSKKRNYMGVVPVMVNSGSKKHKKVIVYNKNNDILDTYNSISECARDIGICRDTVSRSLSNPNHRNNKGYRFELNKC